MEESLDREMRICGTLNASACRYIVEIISIVEKSGVVFIVMEDLHGGELFNELQKSWKNGTHGKKFSETKAAKLAFQVASALAYVHENDIIYRDLKPENLVFTDETHETLKLVDFGLAVEKTDDLGLAGTPGYLAPEVLENKEYDNKIDTWTVGVLIYEILTRRVPFTEKETISRSSPVEFKKTYNISPECQAF